MAYFGTRSIVNLMTIFLFALASYQIGLSSHCASSSLNYSSTHHIDDNDEVKIASLQQKSIATSRASVQESQPTCGVLFFYHIPSTGGSTINTWLGKYTPEKFGNSTYYTYWMPDFRKQKGWHDRHDKSEQRFISGMDRKVIPELQPYEWRISHAHINSLHLNISEDVLYRWRSSIESQGCRLFNTIVFRDPLSHTLSLYKAADRKNSTQSEWAKHLHSATDRGMWSTQLDFFLYNRGRRNPYNLPKEEKVKRAMELLERHFDLVVVSNHEYYMKRVLEVTGWNYQKMRSRNVYHIENVFSKREVEDLMKSIRENGDVDFIDAVKMKFEGYLSQYGV
mmetsp:Transcript_12961/g.25351  ORF Transcript_12961/g.25351 Transcript_12961/m.25351 type:complete len:337 (-) Transcript_12961:124-1134(-)